MINLGSKTTGVSLTSKKKLPANEDNMIPLINIVFLLLVFFMVAGQITAQEPTEFVVPSSQLEKSLEPGATDIVLGADESLWFMQKTVSTDDLSTRLSALKASGAIQPQQLINIKVDAQLKASSIDPIISALKQEGFMRIALVTELVPSTAE